MKSYSGKCVNPGIAIAPITIIKSNDNKVQKNTACDSKTESDRLISSAFLVIKRLQKAKENVGKDAADIFESHIMLLSDDSDVSFLNLANKIIYEESVNAEYAVQKTAETIKMQFENESSDYLRARVEDITHIEGMVIDELCGLDSYVNLNGPSVIVAKELSPEKLLSLPKECVKGIVTVAGSEFSHTAILASDMDVPYITGVDADIMLTTTTDAFDTSLDAALDALEGVIITEADEETKKLYNKKAQRDKEKKAISMNNLGQMLSQIPIKLYANIGNPKEAKAADECDAAGIGLFRSEFLYMGRRILPDEEEQFEAYVQALDIMGDKPVIIRTIDIGDDKAVKCLQQFNKSDSKDAARGIQVCFDNPEIFTTQIRALLRAAYNRNLIIMFPMITSQSEVKKAVDFINDAATELKSEGAGYAIPPIGIMVETPEAVTILEDIAPLIDFVSIGTNDLTRCMLADGSISDGDEENGDYKAHHPAVLKLIRETVKRAHGVNLEVGICGALGADASLAEFFLEIGVDELSMPPSKIHKMAFAIYEALKNEKI